jgi:photosystem II stability/assembly factor-like uncharacterized protein
MKTLLTLSFALFLALGTQCQTVWYPLESNTSRDLRCIDFVTDEIGYAAGDSVLIKTIDGGVTWNEVEIDSIFVNNWQGWFAYDIQFFTELHGRMVLGQWGGMVETFDGGVNWSSFTPLSSGFCQFGSLFFHDADNGLAGGAGCFESAIIDRYTNGEWSLTELPAIWDTEDLVNNFDFFDEDNGLACTYTGRILKTTDGGSTWDSIPNPAYLANITDIAYLTADSVYATYAIENSNGVMISLDGGLTWAEDWESFTFFMPQMYAAHVSNSGRPYFAGEHTFAEGQGMVYDHLGPFLNYTAVSHAIRDIDSYGDDVTFLVGDSGAVFCNTDLLLVDNIISLKKSLDFSIWPNPTNDFLTIETSLDLPQSVQYEVLDIKGQLVLSGRLNQRQAQMIDVSNLATGDYLIEVLGAYEVLGVMRFQKF